MHFIEVILLSAAISVDALGAGLTYGLRRIRVPAYAALLVAFTSLMGMAVSTLVGSTAGGWAISSRNLPCRSTKLPLPACAFC